MTDWLGKRPAVACVGLSAFDYIWQAERLPDPSVSKVRAAGFLTRGGGMAATAAVAVARLGGAAHYIGRAGDDTEGRAMRDELAGAGVDVAAFLLAPGARSSVSGVLVGEGGERLIANFRGSGLPDAPHFLPLPAVGAVLGDPRWPTGVVAAFEAARAAGVPTVLDAEVADADIFDRLLPLSGHAVFSEAALIAYAGAADDAALATVAARHGVPVAGVTLGERGVLWREGDATHRREAFSVAVVDTNGAGDVFHGAYALAVGAGAPTADAMAFASAAAALKCTRPDGRQGIPTRDETLALWRP